MYDANIYNKEYTHIHDIQLLYINVEATPCPLGCLSSKIFAPTSFHKLMIIKHKLIYIYINNTLCLLLVKFDQRCLIKQMPTTNRSISMVSHIQHEHSALSSIDLHSLEISSSSWRKKKYKGGAQWTYSALVSPPNRKTVTFDLV